MLEFKDKLDTRAMLLLTRKGWDEMLRDVAYVGKETWIKLLVGRAMGVVRVISTVELVYTVCELGDIEGTRVVIAVKVVLKAGEAD